MYAAYGSQGLRSGGGGLYQRYRWSSWRLGHLKAQLLKVSVPALYSCHYGMSRQVVDNSFARSVNTYL
jgi:hypothetical protein